MRISDWSSDVCSSDLRNEDERARARKWGIDDLDRIYHLHDLAKGDVIFAATGVTDGSLLDGVKLFKDGTTTTESVVMRASSGTIRWVKGEHRKTHGKCVKCTGGFSPGNFPAFRVDRKSVG